MERRTVKWLVCFLVLLLCFMATDARASLIAYYNFDDGTFNDSVGGFHGTGLGNATVISDPTRGMVLSLDGTDDAVAIPQTAGTVNEFSIAMWIYTTVDLAPVSFAGGLNMDVWSPQGVHFKMDNGVVNVGIQGGPGDVVGTTVISVNTWTHIAVSVSTTEIAVYFDGVQEGSTALTSAITAQLNAGAIGAWNNGGTNVQRELTGMTDDVRIYDHALSEAEVKAIMNPVLAYNPSPAVDENNVPLSVQLKWDEPSGLTDPHYDVYFDPVGKTDPNTANAVLVLQNVTPQTDPCYVVTGLQHNLYYFWRINTREGAGGTPNEGVIWYFKTVPPTPIISDNPQDVTVSVGERADFSVVALNAESYEWFFSSSPDPCVAGIPLPDTDSPTLTIASVMLAHEGYYYCVVSNTAGSATSGRAHLLTERLMAHWKFDGDLQDAVNGFHGVGDPNDPCYAAGIDGDAVVITPIHTVNIAHNVGTFPKMSLSLWFNFDSLPGGINSLLHNDGWSGGWVHASVRSNEKASIDVNGGGRVDTLTSVQAGQWYHWVAVYDSVSGDYMSYLNGEIDNEGAAGGAAAVFGPMHIGAWLSGGGALQRFWDGRIDDVRIYNYPLSPLQVASLYVDFEKTKTVCIDKTHPLDRDGNCQIDVNDFADLAVSWLYCALVPDCQFGLP